MNNNLKDEKKGSQNLEEKQISESVENIKNVENKEDKENNSFEDLKKSRNKKIILSLIILLTLILIILTLSTIFAIINLNNKNIINGISIGNEDVSNLSIEDAKSKISKVVDTKLSQEFILYYGDYEVKVVPSQFETFFDIESSIAEAYSVGRSNNLIKDNFDILNLLFNKHNINPIFKCNESAIDSLIAEMQANIPDHLVEPSYYIEGNNLIITSGEDGIVISKNVLKQKILDYINNFYSSNNTIEIPVTDEKSDSINIDKIYSEIKKDPVDAYYTTNPFAVFAHSDGVDFAISIDEAKKLLENTKDTYTIPLKITSPRVTTNQIGTEAFPNLLSTFTTKYNAANTNRSTNLYLAAKKINGLIIMPGETFSYNQTVGKRTAAAGFKEAGIYAGGQVTTGIGGGICQVSSTLYNAVLLANLEIVERCNHGFDPGYVKPGLDATVSWGGPDFKFKNSRNYPIKLVCSVSKGTVLFNLYGLKEENEYEVSIEATITSYIPYKTITQNDATLEVGQTKVLESGSSGCRSVTYKILKQNGKEISRTLISQDTYNPHHRIVAVGTKAISKLQELEKPVSNSNSQETQQEPKDVQEEQSITEQTLQQEELSQKENE